MLTFDLQKFIKAIAQNDGEDKLQFTPGMEYINNIINGDITYCVDQVDFDKFTLTELDNYRSLLGDIFEVNNQANGFYKEIKKLKPKMQHKVNYI